MGTSASNLLVSKREQHGVRPAVSYARCCAFRGWEAGACSTLASAEQARVIKAMIRSPEPPRSVRHASASGGWLLLTRGAIVRPAQAFGGGARTAFPMTHYCILAKQ